MEGDTTYTVYMVACGPAPSGTTPTVEQIMAGDCGPQLRHHPDAVSKIAELVFILLFVALVLAMIERALRLIEQREADRRAGE